MLSRKNFFIALILILFSATGCLNNRRTTTTGGGGSTGSNNSGDTSSGSTGGGGPIDGCSTSSTCFSLTGVATYHWVPAMDSVTEGGVRLGYNLMIAKPIRRAIIQAISGSDVVAQVNTLDDGSFSLNVPGGYSVTLRVLAKTFTQNYSRDTIGPEACSGANWDIRVVDNTTNPRALYTLNGSTVYTSTSSSITFNAPLGFDGTAYISRTAAPFALLDTAVSEMELVCEGKTDATFPLLYMNWSPSNTNSSGNILAGQIGTSYYNREGGVSNLYILGDEDVDTDEYDDHVVAHELGHYMEDRIFRSDSIGGSHSTSDALDPRVAFGEGYGNAISAMTFNDPIYVDTNGAQQIGGFITRMDTAPTGDHRSVQSEKSVQYFLWKLFDNRISGTNNGSFDRIYSVLKNHQAGSSALTSVLTFASYYNQAYGSTAESFRALWEGDLDTPYNALCVGGCTGTLDTADPFDRDNEIGIYYSSVNRHYQPTTGSTFGPEFWRLYKTLNSGRNSATAHDQTNWGNYASGTGVRNKFGNVRWYRYVAASSGTVTISVDNLGSGYSCGGSSDILDMRVYHKGTNEDEDYSSSACPSVSFYASSGETYIVTIQGYSNAVSSWDVVVSP